MEYIDNSLVEKWAPVLDGLTDDYSRRMTAQLLENQAKSIIAEKLGDLNEVDSSVGATTVGRLGAFQKFAFPLVRRIYPQLIANSLVAVQPMSGPVSQIFYLGHNRQHGPEVQNVFSKYNLTYRGMETSSVGGSGIDLDTDDVDTSSLLSSSVGSPSTTMGGQIAAYPEASSIFGWSVSAGEGKTGSGIPEINIEIQQQPVAARTRKMRALWTLEAAQDLRAYHNLDLERELTDLLGSELKLEIDRELVEDLRMIAYDVSTTAAGSFGGFNRNMLDQANSNDFNLSPDMSGAASFTYDHSSDIATNPRGSRHLSNVFLVDFDSSSLGLSPRHVGQAYANLLAAINFASQDIYKSTFRGPGSWILCAPIVAAMLESAVKLEGGIRPGDGPTNMSKGGIEFKGKFAGRYDLFVDPMYPEDEILMGYKGNNPMDAGYVYAPYIPLQQLPTITDPLTFQPRKGILTRYGKAAVTPESRFYRVLRIVGATSPLLTPFANPAVDNGGY